MSLLLDTHAFVWAVTEPGRLSRSARERIGDPRERLFVSAITGWEMSMKQRAGRWPEVAHLLLQHLEVMRELGAASLPFTFDHALTAGSLDWPHRDPFDRALAAQAMREGLALVTKDSAFAQLPGLALVW